MSTARPIALPPLGQYEALRTEDILARLVAFPTVSADSNLPLIEWVVAYLTHYGVEATLIHDKSGTKANLHAVIGPRGRAGGVVLSGHTDVVPVVGQSWQTDPFVLHGDEDRLFGRGTTDMKGFLAAVLSRVPLLASADLTVPVHLAFSYDEEVGCLGVGDLIEALCLDEAPPVLCIVGEPTAMKPITGHKGIYDLRCTVTGLEAHSSQTPQAVNAVEAAAELVVYVQKLARRLSGDGPFHPQYDPPFSTLQTSLFHGGVAVNIVPNHAELAIELRALPGYDAEAVIEEIRQHAFRVIEPRMKDVHPGAGFTFRLNARLAAFDIDDGHAAVAMVRRLSGSNDTAKVSFATEAGLFHQAGIPSVVCGPGLIDQAHKPDEYISRVQLRQAEGFLDRLIEAIRA